MNNIIWLELLDTSLRDGSQKFKDYPTDIEAALMASVLAQLWIPAIEIWVPVAENQSKERLELIIKAVEQTWKNPVLYWFCRCVKEDIDAVLNKMEIAKNKWVNIIISWSELFQILRDPCLKNKNWEKLTPEEISRMEEKVLESIREQVSYASNLFGDNVRVCFEDGSMWKRDFLIKAIKVAWENGAKVISIPDTLWWALPHEIKSLFRYLISETTELIKEKWLKFAIHAHDDRGLALANTLSAIRSWATSIEWTLLGSWERVWNTNLKDVLWNIALMDGFECKWIILNRLYEACKIIHALLWKQWNPNAPFVWEQCTRTQVWIHQSLENKSSSELEDFFKKYWRLTPYSLVDITQFWVPQLELNMYTKLSWFSNLEACLKPYGINLDKNDSLEKKITDWLQPDLDNTKVVYASRVYTEYLIQTLEMNRITWDDIKITDEKISINLVFWRKELKLEADLTEKDWALWTTVKAISSFIHPEYNLELTDFSLIMHEWDGIIAKRYKETLGWAYALCETKVEGQMWIANIEWLFIDNNTGDKIPFTTIAHDLHWDMADIKAILYACIPLIYEKVKKDDYTEEMNYSI